jgi:phosphopantetheinyl transferase
MVGPTCLWRYARLDDSLDTGCADGAAAWLSDQERQGWRRIGDGTRRRSWLAGRALVKRLVFATLAPAESRAIKPQQIEVDSGGAGRPGKRPVVSIDGHRWRRAISITHTAEAVLVAVAARPEVALGVDLVGDVSFGRGFQRLWFTAAERRHVAGHRQQQRAARIWAVKEAVFKACNRGEAFRPATINVIPQADGRYTSHYGGVRLSPPARIRVAQFDRHTAALVTFSDTTIAR